MVEKVTEEERHEGCKQSEKVWKCKGERSLYGMSYSSVRTKRVRDQRM